MIVLMLDALPPPPQPIIIVEEAKSHQPAIFLSFMVVGAAADMARLEKRAAELKLPTGRTNNDKGEEEVMIMFPPQTDRAAGLQLYRDALGGKYGALKLEVVLISREKAADGIDMDTDASVEDPSYILVPAN
jgi:hypothetical protein